MRRNALPDGVGLRERKAAVTRLALSRALWARLAESDLDDISADELAARVEVSRMTFFNYFPTKIDALEFSWVTWDYEGRLEVASRDLEGLAALELIFSRMGRFVQESPQRARRFIGHFTMRDGNKPLPSLTDADLLLLTPKGHAPLDASMEPPGKYMVRQVQTALDRGELCAPNGAYELAHLLGSLLYGTALVGHSRPRQDWQHLYAHHLEHALVAARVTPGDTPARNRTRAKKGRAR